MNRPVFHLTTAEYFTCIVFHKHPTDRRIDLGVYKYHNIPNNENRFQAFINFLVNVKRCDRFEMNVYTKPPAASGSRSRRRQVSKEKGKFLFKYYHNLKPQDK
jgi:hypothetical protein